MRLGYLAVAAAVAMVPIGASAAIVTTIGNQSNIFYDGSPGNNPDLGDFDLGVAPVGVSANIAADNTTGSFKFGVFSSGGLPARGSIDVNLVSGNEPFSGTFDGTPLTFTTEKGDFVASFGTSFADGSDVAEFVLNFSGFDSGDLIQVNVAAIPLPASVLMLLGALAGLSVIGRRRSA
jgi:hypothetical protein